MKESCGLQLPMNQATDWQIAVGWGNVISITLFKSINVNQIHYFSIK